MSSFSHSYSNGWDVTSSIPQSAPPGPTSLFNATPTFVDDDLDLAFMSGEGDAQDLDCNTQLRPQRLNSDGTPKRPMNSFMIFARKRRPMVSLEQPTMRTGQISKLLSKEWSIMPQAEKQFYFEQAKMLRDTFDARWPDYVYTRRPNKSRKRRKRGGAPGTGIARNGDAASESQVSIPIDLAAATYDGDEIMSQSADSFSSPTSTLPMTLYPAARPTHMAPTHGLGHLPGSSTMPPGYEGRSVYAPTPANALGDQPALHQPKPQPKLYGASQNSYHTPNGDHERSVETNLQIMHWHQCEFDFADAGTIAPSTQLLSTASVQSGCNAEPAGQLHDWPKTQNQTYEDKVNVWSARVEPHGSEALMIESFLREDISGLHQCFGAGAGGDTDLPIPVLCDHVEGAMRENSCYPLAYIDRNRLNQGAYPPELHPLQEEALCNAESVCTSANRWMSGLGPK